MKPALQLALLILLADPVVAQRSSVTAGPGLFGARSWRPPVAEAADLPAAGNREGDVRLVLADHSLQAWDGAAWQALQAEGGGLPAHARVVTVDSSLQAAPESLRFSSVKAACDYVAAQPGRSASTQWLIRVYPGAAGAGSSYFDTVNYAEEPLSVPSYTAIEGVAVGHNIPIAWTGATPVVMFSAASGNMVTLGEGSTMSNLSLIYLGSPAGTVNVLYKPLGNGLELGVTTNVVITTLQLSNEHPVRAIHAEGGIYTYDTSVFIGGFVHPGTRAVSSVPAASGAGAALYGGRFGASPALGGCDALMYFDGAAAAGYPGLKLFWLRVDGGCATDIVTANGGTAQVTGTPFVPSGSAVQAMDVPAGIGADPPGTCSPGQIFVDNSAGAERLCGCTAANTWRCVGVS